MATTSKLEAHDQQAIEQVDILKIPLPKLRELSQQLDEQVEYLSHSIQSLKILQQKFSESNESLTLFKPENLNKELLVPMTSTLYVPGQIDDVEKVTIGIGTGYFAEVTISQARAYFKRKMDYLGKQIELVQGPLQEKCHAKQAVMEALQIKVQQALQQQAQQTQS